MHTLLPLFLHIAKNRLKTNLINAEAFYLQSTEIIFHSLWWAVNFRGIFWYYFPIMREFRFYSWKLVCLTQILMVTVSYTINAFIFLGLSEISS